MIEKLIRNGKVAVLISPGHGAGWSSWTLNGNEQFMLFDKTLALMAERGATETEVRTYLESIDIDDFSGGWEDIIIVWLEEGETFIIEEYDGHENLQILSDQKYFTA